MKPIFIIKLPIRSTPKDREDVTVFISNHPIDKEYHVLTCIGMKDDYEFVCCNGNNLTDIQLDNLRIELGLNIKK